jgi:D-alanine-D-alanine ligase
VSKIRVGIVFGGRSGEHEVSLMSARSVMDALDRDRYDIVPIGISRDGRWLTAGDPLRTLRSMAPETEQWSGGAAEQGRSGGTESLALSRTREDKSRRDLLPGLGAAGIPYVDVLFPVLHGPYGEDGTVQGLFELAGIPYVGAGVLGSALAMDKVAMKAIFCAERFPVADYEPVMRWEWDQQPTLVGARVERRVGYPCFVKPANLGSSVGVTKVHAAAELSGALDVAARYDRKILVEKAVNAREIECSVLGNDHPVASLPGEVIPHREFYDYEAKYLDGDTQLIVPAALTASKAAEIQELAVRAFTALDCAGMARADFFLDRVTDQVYINELNTIPGFTAVSMYPRMWAASGLPYPELLDRLIQLAFERHRDKGRMSTAYRSNE